LNLEEVERLRITKRNDCSIEVDDGLSLRFGVFFVLEGYTVAIV